MKLAVIGRVVETAKISGADRIQQAFVDCGDAGRWTGVVGKDIEAGNMVTVFLQDAVLPPDPRWAFMEKHKWRVRMARFKGVPSECVIIPVCFGLESGIDHVGADITEALGVTKYSKPIPAGMAGDAVGPFPSFIPKTDEPNFQAVPELVEELRGQPYEARMKCDGSSCTAWRDDGGELHVASRNWELREFTATGAENVYWRAARLYDWSKLPPGVAMQFEVVGPGVQGNPMGLSRVEGRAFTAYSYKEHKRLPNHRLALIASDVGIPLAPLIPMPPCFDLSDDHLRDLASVLKYHNGKPAEGVVIRSPDQRISFKVISLNYKD